jgi:cell division protein FtsL
MAACTTTYFDAGRSRSGSAGSSWRERVAEHNAELLAQQPLKRRRVRTPEFHFVKHFDNSRLVKAPDPVRAREMRVFSGAVAVLFSLVMVYGLQHFYAIESSYRVESEKQAIEQLREQNRQLRLSVAELSQPARIDRLARQLGFTEPQPGQVVYAIPGPNVGVTMLAQLARPVPAGQ